MNTTVRAKAGAEAKAKDLKQFTHIDNRQSAYNIHIYIGKYQK